MGCQSCGTILFYERVASECDGIWTEAGEWHKGRNHDYCRFLYGGVTFGPTLFHDVSARE